MREKIKASLAAKEATEFQPSSPKPSYERFSGQNRPASRSPENGSASERTRSDKARQIHDAVSSGYAYDQPWQQRAPQPQHQQRSGGNVATAQRPPRPTPPRHYEPVREESNAGKICIIIGIAVLAVLLLGYIAGLAVYHSKFLPKTYVNGVDIGGMTAEEASDAVLNTAQDMGLTFIPKNRRPDHLQGLLIRLHRYPAGQRSDRAGRRKSRPLVQEAVLQNRVYSQDAGFLLGRCTGQPDRRL